MEGNVKEYIEKSEKYFSMRYHCSQAVLVAFANELGISDVQALKLGGCFGGGMCMGEVCGVVIGGMMALGLKFGQSDIDDLNSRIKANDVAKALLHRFKEENGSYICRELLHYDLSIEKERIKVIEMDLFRTFCPQMVESATQITYDLLSGK